MSHDAIRTKEQAHELIGHLPPAQLAAVVGLLEAMLDPVSVALAAAPIDDEPEKEEERQTASESQEWFRRHAGIPFEEVLADFGVTVNDLNDYKKPK